MSNRDGVPSEGSAAAVLWLFVEQSHTSLARSASCEGSDSPHGGQPCSRCESGWNITALESKLRQLSTVCVGRAGGAMLNETVSGLAHSTVEALVRLVVRLLPIERLPVPASDNDQLSGENKATAARRLVDLAILSLANLLDDQPWRHLFFRVLHQIRVDVHHDEASTTGSCLVRNGPAGLSIPTASVQDALWRRLVTSSLAPDVGSATVGDREGCSPKTNFGSDDTTKVGLLPNHPKLIVAPLHRGAARLICHMVRHCPLSLSASSYASLASLLTDYLLGETLGRERRDRHQNTASSGKLPGSSKWGNVDMTDSVLLDLFAACARGSSHFRQYVKDSGRKRDLFKRFLGLLNVGPQGESDGMVVRALCALTRIVAGDPLEGKVRCIYVIYYDCYRVCSQERGCLVEVFSAAVPCEDGEIE